MDLIDNWNEEKRSAYLYTIVAASEKDENKKRMFLELSGMANKQAGIWETQIKNANLSVPEFKPDWRTRLIARLVRITGPNYLRFILAATKVRGMSVYRHEIDVESKHNTIRHGNNIRAAVFGINDGLVSNASLILGIAGAQANVSMIILTGVAGLLAGACSMGSGEYVSVRSQREMLEYQLALEKHELETYPEEEEAELALIYETRGLPKEEAAKVAHLLIQNPSKALDALAREELGINPDDLVSPWGAAISSFISFCVGAAVPLIPFLMTQNHTLFYSILLTGIALFSVGAILSFFSQKNILWSGLRTMLIGLASGALTYLIGHLLGVSSGL
jgi:VIT1/CCC1 family predicted Fe2+/Mn2+ transporter